MASHRYMPSSPTLFNSGTPRPQMSSCYLLDSPRRRPRRDLRPLHRRRPALEVRRRDRPGLPPDPLARVADPRDQRAQQRRRPLAEDAGLLRGRRQPGGKRKGACCVYLETWHADIEEFLELKDNTGRRGAADLQPEPRQLGARPLHEAGGGRARTGRCSTPRASPTSRTSTATRSRRPIAKAEEEGLAVKQVAARELYARMMKTLAETGNGWMNFKDACNRKSNQTLRPENVVHSSNLCTEIVEVTSAGETAVCNLGSVNLARHVDDGGFDFDALAETVRTAVRFLDRVIDINFYPTPEAAASNQRWRPVGPGPHGPPGRLLPAAAAVRRPEARELSARIQEEIYFQALSVSCDLAEAHGPHPAFAETRAAQGVFQFDLWDVRPADVARWEALRERIRRHGLRNSLLVAIAPTATIASIVGAYECIEPQVSNLFKRETLSGEFLQVNRYLVGSSRRSACGPRRSATGSSWPKVRSRGSRRSRPSSARSSARSGKSRCARSSTWRPTARRSSTRASRSTCSSRARRSASSRRCTCMPGSKG